MIMGLLELRARLRQIYQKTQLFVDPILKFIIGYFVYSQINASIGYDARFAKVSIVLLLSLLSAFAPSGVMVLLAMLLSLAHIYSVSVFLAVFVLCIFIILYCLFLRYTSKYGLVVVAIPLLTMWNMPYAIPVFLGLTANPITILPTSCGVFIYYLFQIIKEAAATKVKVEDILQFYTDVVDAIIGNQQMIAVIVCYALVILTVYFIRKLQFEYVFEIAIGAGVLVNILGLLIASLTYGLDQSIGLIILMSILSGIIVLIAHFFYRILDYTAVERVQFEDDDYYYYVKAVPKIDISVPKRQVKQINSKREAELEDTYQYSANRFSSTGSKRKNEPPVRRMEKDDFIEIEYDEEIFEPFESRAPDKTRDPYSVKSNERRRDNTSERQFNFTSDDEGYEVDMDLDDDL